MPLSELQRNIINATGKVVVKACPGSGKTYSVAARIAHLLKTKNFHHNGIAAISFTNTAWKEINEKLTTVFNVNTPLPYPHFVGTIDSFLNQYIFLPFGHLILKTGQRPNLVGEPHSHWSGKFYKDSFFDKISINIEGDFFDKIGSRIPRSIKNGPNNVYTVKNQLLRKGFCNQSDANYFALQVIKTYPQIAKNIVNRFPYFIIDEAQDTNDIQMEIINILVENGLEEIMLIGDPNQAIFEWNNANPLLFEEKYLSWNPLTLDENRRSSKKICDCSNAFIGNEVSKPIEGEEITDFAYTPVVRSTKNDDEVQNEIDTFLKDCEDLGIEITHEKVAVLYRSKSFKKHFGEEQVEFDNQPWKNGAFHLRDIVQGKYLLEQGEFKNGFKLMEQGYFKGTMKIPHVKREQIQKIINKIGFVPYRKKIFDFIDSLPETNKVLYDWLEQAKLTLEESGIEIDYTKTKANVSICSLFDIQNKQTLPYYHGTIHSAKGCTFDAVLILLSERASNSGTYRNLLNKDFEQLDSSKQEELRIVYVALTRPRKVLKISVPKDDLELWEDKLLLSRKPVQLSLFG